MPPPINVQTTVSSNQSDFRLLLPDPYTVYQLTPVTPFDTQKIRFSVSVPPETTSVTYYIDDQPVETVRSEPWSSWWALTPGIHQLKAVAALADNKTETSAPVTFSVVSFVPPDEQSPSGEVK